MSLVVNGLPVASMRFYAPWSGVWNADLEIPGDVLPSGRVVIVSTEGVSLVGTVDARRSSTFGERRIARVVGGNAGWEKSVRPQHYHSDVGLPLLTIVSTTAAEVGEVATVLAPKLVGTDFARLGAPCTAAQIFRDAGVDWWVGYDGVTKVGVRLPVPPHPSLLINEWDGATGTASFVCDVIPEPGTVIVDVRFLGARRIREVEAVVAGASVSGTIWLVEDLPAVGMVSELASEFAAIARAATRPELGRVHEYRVGLMQGDRVMLQAVIPPGARSAPDGVPDLLPASVWAGISGYRAMLNPSSRVLVGFIAGDPKRPYVAAYEPPEGGGWRPIQLELDAQAAVVIGEEALAVTIGAAAGARPVARLTPTFATWIAAVSTYINGLAPGTVVPPVDIASVKVVSA